MTLGYHLFHFCSYFYWFWLITRSCSNESTKILARILTISNSSILTQKCHTSVKNIKAFSVVPGFDLVHFKNRKTKPHVLTCNKFMYRESNQVETEKLNKRASTWNKSTCQISEESPKNAETSTNGGVIHIFCLFWSMLSPCNRISSCEMIWTACWRITNFVWGLSVFRCDWQMRPRSLNASLMSFTRRRSRALFARRLKYS